MNDVIIAFLQRATQNLALAINKALNPSKESPTVGFILITFNKNGPELVFASTETRERVLEISEAFVVKLKMLGTK